MAHWLDTNCKNLQFKFSTDFFPISKYSSRKINELKYDVNAHKACLLLKELTLKEQKIPKSCL